MPKNQEYIEIREDKKTGEWHVKFIKPEPKITIKSVKAVKDKRYYMSKIFGFAIGFLYVFFLFGIVSYNILLAVYCLLFLLLFILWRHKYLTSAPSGEFYFFAGVKNILRVKDFFDFNKNIIHFCTKHLFEIINS